MTTPQDLAALVTALRAQRQIDMDGCEVAVSRQACDEAADALTAAQERIEMAECAGFSAGYEAGQKDVESLLDAAYAAGQERMREAAIERCVNILTETGITGGIPDDPLTGLVRDDILTLPITPRPDRGDRA